MKRVLSHPYLLKTATLLAVVILGGVCLHVYGPLWGELKPAATPPAAPAQEAASVPGASPSGITFFTKKTRLWLDRSQVLCFSAKQKVEESRYLGFKVDEKYLHVLIPPTLLPGATIGYLRVRPLTEGRTQVNLEGATIDVEIIKDTAASTLEQTRPEIVSPVNGAVVWGSFGVGVEQLNLSTSAPRLRPVLRLPDGHEIEAQEVPNQQPGPHLRYAYTVDAKALHPGSNDLVAVIKDETGHEIASEPLAVTVINPDPAAMVSGDCKDQVNTELPPPPAPKVPPATPPPPPRPFVPPTVIADDKGNLGQVVSSPNDNPPWCMPVTVPGKGRYVMVVTARGDIGANALPTIGIGVDRDQNPLTTVRLSTTDWQRIPVGRPFVLEDGAHVLSVRFRNGFNQGPTDSRHLYLAHYELLRIDPPLAPPPVLADNSTGSSPMTMQAGAPAAAAATTTSPASAPSTATTSPPASAAPPAPATAPAPATSPTMQTVAAAPPAPAPTPTAPPTPSVPSPSATTMQTAAAAPPAPAPPPPVSAATMAMMQSLPPSGSLHVVFRDALEGQTIGGQVQINAMCWWPNREHSPPPTVELLVNDKVVASVSTQQPQFRIDVSAFQPGKNKIQLRGTLPSGQHAHSSVETLFLPKELAVGNEPYRPGYKFYVNDPAWNGSMNERVNSGDPDEVAAFYSNGDSTLTLPEDLQGRYKVSIEARGTDFNGPAVATVLLKTNGEEKKLGEVPAGGNMAELPVAQTTFAAGPKTLIVRYANDAYEKDKGDRNLFVHGVRLEPVASAASAAAVASDPPTAAIAYPANGATVGMADAVIANVSGRDGAVHADLLIDGKAQHLNLSPPNGLGPVLLPLLTRNLTPGPHRVQVTAQDHDGHTAQSSEVNVIVAGPDQAVDNDYSRALFLLNRFGYGPEPREIAAILTMGRHAWLEARLNETIESPDEENEQQRLHAEFPDPNAAIPRALQYLATDANPVRGRFLMWTENHFSTWQNKDGPAEKAREHDRFLELGVAPFSDLLLASATSPAMLIYLDQRNSVAHRLNENYAREIMELHTLGVKGGYTQLDVTTLADLLTGWTLADEAPMNGASNLVHTFRYDPYLNSGDPCQILGMDFPGVPLERRFDRVLTALNMLAAHPSCAQFISRKLVEHYVSDPAPPALVNEMAQDYMETGGDLRVMLLDLSEKPEFWAAAPKIASPIDFAVRLARLSNLANPGALNDLASHSGMGMFDRATPDGYPDADGYYASSNALLQRWHFAQAVQNNFLNNGMIPNDWKPADKQWNPATTQRLVDLAAVRITGGVLSPNSNAAALQLIAAAPENTDARLHLLTTFLCQVPETSLR